LGWVSDEVLADGTFEVGLVAPPDLNRRLLRVAAWRLIGAVAESATNVREVSDQAGVTFEVVTGTPGDPDGFATHGHTLRLRFTYGR
ncbi:MAG: hypothetical protein JWM51_1282, partial [Microbacteriaceae bacterium]|nr:hypothetical protein [Microbacteriaceae bacterium]